MITKQVFDRVQEVMKGNPKGPSGTKEFGFTKMFKCGACGSGVTPDEKIKRLKDGTIKRYVYYGCNKKWITGCKEPYLREEDLLNQLCKIIDKVDIDELAAVDRIKQEMERLKKMIASLGGHAATAKIAEIMPDIDVYACAKYILKEGTREEKRDLLNHVQTSLTIQSGKIVDF